MTLRWWLHVGPNETAAMAYSRPRFYRRGEVRITGCVAGTVRVGIRVSDG